ncbi:ATP-dependent DNA helicase RecG [Anaerosacchariphilus polymeriproducens]|uniref:ATP-dependent DNA helicase RecG n=1 Tax=Anaerosacchariphilus polymeriproducens TaxID=1812858 RepID=A0A371AU55_9FIRM|nr:ATP-dependent DNA helicase RecG [Anaerosacchariphilus polymeriproducens]RDU23095.1 ATP-dependent DNA helicase RecG [Anaerosacchariphilus polymeriproducens]
MKVTDSIDSLKGIGEKTKLLFYKIGIYQLNDLLHYYPRDYEIYKEPSPLKDIDTDRPVAVIGLIEKELQIKTIGRLKLITTTIKVDDEKIKITWFNMPYLKNSLKSGMKFVFYGKINEKKKMKTMDHPQIFTREEYQKKMFSMQPVYSLTAGLTNNVVIKAIKQVLNQYEIYQEYLPERIRTKHQLAEYNFAIQTIHVPLNEEELILARKRLVFDEFFLFILNLQKMKEACEKLKSPFHLKYVDETIQLERALPYQLTAAQKRVWNEIQKDFDSSKVMSRLIQGDVGSGKTILAIMALIRVVKNGFQGSLMVPTEVLARQHYESMTKMFNDYNLQIKVILLTGSLTLKEKREAYQKIKSQDVDIIVGTHALIQEKVEYANLALVITDEQHRFGVRQREIFAQKGKMPHILVMSATPIPRTLAIILYGDLDISIVDEVPAERLPIKNCVVNTEYRPTAYRFIQKEVEKNRQVYIICPLVEESEGLDAENVIDYTKKLKNLLPSAINIEYLHGRMKGKEKNEIMERFLKNEIQILVSTTVIEVGINVPNASVILIENAERFGLAQLHQLRGRVGRGAHQSFCILIDSSSKKGITKRLEILNQSNDGFFIANEDLKLRGPGDLFGKRQSGILEFKIADIYQDASILQLAAEEVNQILQDDPNLETEENRQIKEQIEKLKNLEQINL